MKKNTVGKLISYIHRMHQRELASTLKLYGLGGGGHHSYLKTIIQAPGLNQDQLTHEVNFDKATTARCVKQLEEAGYVLRVVDELDRRSYRVYPTEKAIEFAPVLSDILHQYNVELTACLSPAEKDQLTDLLQKIYDHKQINN
ncbi:MarR family transcriptional regulator [Paenibacillus sp. CAA11]|uniref:MarR family winged helix-turn-helix transcriptional regulator n=1 Tax=Paenibacillus sp. CAA11 TaxID=1532905 RepID=UPI000D3A76F8|nr:MarR family transcriptional regulator [Paenibacillus sp. CAA11]AWB44579.1 MarR family transcriptional regulator [Paenibacillus sp. CAA11]